MEDFVVNAAPVAVALLICGIALVSVRRASRRASPAARTETGSAAE